LGTHKINLEPITHIYVGEKFRIIKTNKLPSTSRESAISHTMKKGLFSKTTTSENN